MQNRTGALAATLIALGVTGVFWLRRTPSSEPGLPCPPDQIRWVAPEGRPPYAVCASALGDNVGVAPPARIALTLGRKLRLNQASEQDLGVLPGVGAKLARAIVQERARVGGGFASWAQVDEVPGVGASKLETLMALTELEVR